MLHSSFRILTINPGSTSTKIGMFQNNTLLFETTIRHSTHELDTFDDITDQIPFRKDTILQVLKSEGYYIDEIDAFCGRGGLLRPIPGGTYEVNEPMLTDLRNGYSGQHASNLGGIIAHDLAQLCGKPAYIVDPVVVDELQELATFSGVPHIQRKSIFHALNQKAVARRVATEMNKPYEELKLIVVHMGGGITVGVHAKGKVIDVNNGLNGDGPFSPERAGTVPAGDLVNLCFSGEYFLEDIKKMLVGKGGLVGYLGTNDAVEVEKRMAKGDQKAKMVYEAMAYQISKEIGAASSVLSGNVDAIILTGGLAYGKDFIHLIQERVSWIAEVIVKPGENELQALAEGALRVLEGQEAAKKY